MQKPRCLEISAGVFLFSHIVFDCGWLWLSKNVAVFKHFLSTAACAAQFGT